MRVRPIRGEQDVRELTVAHGRAWRAAYEGILPESVIRRVEAEEPPADRVQADLDRLTGYGPGRVLVVTDASDTVRGYAVFRWPADETKDSVRPNEAELKELYVDPDRWGEGYGTALLEAGIERMPDDVDSLALETLEGNDVGAGFYEARGFERDGTGSFEVDGESSPTRVYRKPL
ncbi:MAG: GNAT family N-acetyltransferase [Halobacteriales archaeon]|nr:GNAT family N-acetyltransferase [Halobacteriales archaeon]